MTQSQRQAIFDSAYTTGYNHGFREVTFQSNSVQYAIDYHNGYSMGYSHGKIDRESWRNKNCA